MKMPGPPSIMDAPLIPSDVIRGTVSDLWTWAANSYGNFVRKYGYHPTDPNPDPIGRQLAMKDLATVWASMTPDQQQTWHRLSQIKRLPKYTVFMGVNLHRVFVGQAPVTSP